MRSRAATDDLFIMRARFRRYVVCCFAATALAAAASAQTRYTTIVLDPGHGGFDRGGIPGQRVPEKMMTLDVSLRLKPLLEKAGYKVVLTRNTDVFVPLGTRVAMANSYPNAIFVCIHFNSATRSGANGIETYFYSTESAPLAASIHSAVVGGAPSENRGVRRRGYFVLRKTIVPAVLVECGFLTNPTEAQYAQTSTYRQQLAQEIARGILNRPALATRTTYTNRSSRVDVGLQPFLDQRFVRESGTKHHRRHKTSTNKKSSSAEKKKVSSEEQ
jgi:N-acetylmuramoyl-L-alanine amidase